MNHFLLRCVLMGLLLSSGVAYAAFHDPTQPYTFVEKSNDKSAEGPLVLQAIFISQHQRIAVVNGELLKIGDVIQDNRLVTIESNFVILDNAGEKTFLHLIDPVKRAVLNGTNK